MATTVQPQQPVQDGHTELRRLKPAADAAARAGQLGEQAVQELCRRAPSSLKPSLEAAVERASPLVAKAADSGSAWAGEPGPGPRPVAGSRRSPRRRVEVTAREGSCRPAGCSAFALVMLVVSNLPAVGVHKRITLCKLAGAAAPFRAGIQPPRRRVACTASTLPACHLVQGPRC